ncbi:DUF305 domain-containing protein [Deinococcus psychrotolerans]|uniref:DUF305 domain-containing protein n=1 Tax=Deinococcus psychrotolerans TaxID=2489213 RepID=A0A3G8YG35_9DEIO|nr:DUF305 domain-containing protein [Deinococcus psychrotolerans]AZI44248.1 DUF305 domain-containing protein [Deinococcus psychrotolerans]
MSYKPQRLAALALLLFAVGLGVFLLLTPHIPAPAFDSPEVTFTRGMIAHHTQAITMAMLIRQRSTDRTIRSAALDIQLSQEEQIRQMRGFLRLWKQPDTFVVSADHARMMGMASGAELQSLKTLSVPRAEVEFLRLMTRHHQGALQMIPPALEPGVLPQVRHLARQMQVVQGGEIRFMTSLLRARGAKVLPFPEMNMPGMEH